MQRVANSKIQALLAIGSLYTPTPEIMWQGWAYLLSSGHPDVARTYVQSVATSMENVASAWISRNHSSWSGNVDYDSWRGNVDYDSWGGNIDHGNATGLQLPPLDKQMSGVGRAAQTLRAQETLVRNRNR